MRLVTYTDAEGVDRAGALLDQDLQVLDLQSAYRAREGRDSQALSSILALVEAGEPALELARTLVARAPVAALVERATVKLRAPIQPPPQMRDCSCFELHLRQAFAAYPAAKSCSGLAPWPDPPISVGMARARSSRASDVVTWPLRPPPVARASAV